MIFYPVDNWQRLKTFSVPLASATIVAAEHPTMHGDSPTAQNYPAQNISSTKVWKPS
jgi:hypothetical protein